MEFSNPQQFSAKRKRRILGVVTFLLLVGTFALQISFRPPTTDFDRPPAGWATSEPSSDLTGSLAGYHQAVTPFFLNTTDYARIAAYASQAYTNVRWTNGGDDREAQAAFFEVASHLLVDPDNSVRFPRTEPSELSRSVAADIIVRADNDGYAVTEPQALDYRSPLVLDVDPKLYSWMPAVGNGNEVEPFWGELTAIDGIFCDVPPPPISTYAELKAAANRTGELVNQFRSREDSPKLRTLADSYVSSLNSSPARLWLEIAANVTVDGKLGRKEADILLRDVAIAIHNTQISAWAAKWGYALSHPIAITDNYRPLLPPTNPSYPSEFSAVAMASKTIIDRYAPGVQIRLEIPGSMISVPTTRILPNTDAAVTEAETVAQVLGLDYIFSSEAGRALGRCIGEGVLS
jgi:hypothetical protein